MLLRISPPPFFILHLLLYFTLLGSCTHTQETHRRSLGALSAGLWRGSAVTLVRDWPSFGVYFAVYEGMQELLSPGSRQSHVIHPVALLMAGEYTLNPQTLKSTLLSSYGM